MRRDLLRGSVSCDAPGLPLLKTSPAARRDTAFMARDGEVQARTVKMPPHDA